MTRTIPELIVHKREGGELDGDEIRALIDGFVDGSVADYQMSAMAMAVFFRGMSPRETAALTLAMRDSGTVIDTRGISGAKVDKHSTGGVGDKVSICLAPIVAACGVRVPMVSGRGLGHTGGTLDKLEAIPGFSVSMSTDAFVRQVSDVGCALIGQTADIAPADKRLYALRDVTGTVESIPLITASILSKKLAEGIDALVLDVKVGRGAFMKTRKDARALAESIVRVGKLAKKKVVAVLTSMDAPLGRAIGNGLETREALEVLRGGGPSDLVECTLVLGAEMLRLAGIAKSDSAARSLMKRAIEDGSALHTMERVVEAQGGDRRAVRDLDLLPLAPHQLSLLARTSGYVTEIDPLELGLSAVALGAGRTRADQAIDPSVGIVLGAQVGDAIRKGDVLATIHAKDAASADEIAPRITGAIAIGKSKPRKRALVLDVMR